MIASSLCTVVNAIFGKRETPPVHVIGYDHCKCKWGLSTSMAEKTPRKLQRVKTIWGNSRSRMQQPIAACTSDFHLMILTFCNLHWQCFPAIKYGKDLPCWCSGQNLQLSQVVFFLYQVAHLLMCMHYLLSCCHLPLQLALVVFFAINQPFSNVHKHKLACVATCTVWWWFYVVFCVCVYIRQVSLICALLNPPLQICWFTVTRCVPSGPKIVCYLVARQRISKM